MKHSLAAIQKVADDIKSIKIQWATNIAKAAFEIMIFELKSKKFKTIKELESFVKQGTNLLIKARSTEPMLFNGMKFALTHFETWNIQQATSSIKRLQAKIIKAFKTYLLDIQGEEKIRPVVGAKLIKKNYQVMTHCHSGSVIKVLTSAWQQGKKFHVYNTETRPLYQWRKTSVDLLKAGVPDTMITDGSAPFFVDNLYESDVNIDIVLMWSDCIKINGDVYNKIGSFAIALAAWHSWIPVYVVGSLMKVDVNNNIHIEKRSEKEIWKDAPKWLEIVNYAFDIIPAKFITWIITEYGIIKPREIKKYVKTYYPRMF